MGSEVFAAIEADGFTPLGGFEPQAQDRLHDAARTVVLIGNAGPAMFRRFEAERAGPRESLDEWTRRAVDSLARRLGARALFPFDQPPWPFLSWGRRAGAGHVSPLGLNIHPVYGLWHAYRAALLFDRRLELAAISAGPHPCEACTDRPCLRACPVGAFDAGAYAVQDCTRHLDQAGNACLPGGCQARLACPVGREFTYGVAQLRFHMRAFHAAMSPAGRHFSATQR